MQIQEVRLFSCLLCCVAVLSIFAHQPLGFLPRIVLLACFDKSGIWRWISSSSTGPIEVLIEVLHPDRVDGYAWA